MSALATGAALVPAAASGFPALTSAAQQPAAGEPKTTEPGASAGVGADGPGSFDFLFITDTHLEPELAAADGCAMAFRKAASLNADFAIQGGDHVFDALAVDRKRADSLFDLYAQTEKALGMKVHHAMGNHDHFGIFNSGVTPQSPGYGKALFHERIGPSFYSFDAKGYHFIVLDSIQTTADRSWEARIDSSQIEWLAADLGKVAVGTPVIVITHVPLVTAFTAYSSPAGAGGSGTTPTAPAAVVHPQLSVVNAYEVLPLLERHNVLAVLQGHTHINEVVTFRGIPYVTSGAVCGNWWQGTRMGIPEGFTVVSLRKGKIDWRYETYGFKSVDPHNT